MKLNLGCGTSKQRGYINVDKYAALGPDVVWDLEAFPWPWPDNMADEVLFSHVLEHLGATADGFFGVMKELYRVCKHDAQIRIIVPHPRHDDFISDPTHVRAITPQLLELFSKANNAAWAESGAANTQLARITGTDFTVAQWEVVLDPHWAKKVDDNEITREQVKEAMRNHNNVVKEFRITLRVVKP